MKYFLLFMVFTSFLAGDYEQVELKVYKEELTKKSSIKTETLLTFRTPQDSIHILLNDAVIEKIKLTRKNPNDAWYDEWCLENYVISNNEFKTSDTLEIRFLELNKKFLIPIDKKYGNIDLFYTAPQNKRTRRNAILNYKNSNWITE